MKYLFTKFRMLALLGLLGLSGGFASAEETAGTDTEAGPVQYLVLNKTDGSVMCFALAERPRVTFADGHLTVACGTTEISAPFTEVSNYRFSVDDITYDPNQGGNDDPDVDPVENPVQYLVLNKKDGSAICFALAEKPRVTYTADGLTITCGDREVSAPFTEVNNYKFSIDDISTEEPEPTAISRHDSVRIPCFAAGHAVFSGLKAGSRVVVASVSGAVVQQFTVPESGQLDIDLTQLPRGIFVLSTSGGSYKVTNK